MPAQGRIAGAIGTKAIPRHDGGVEVRVSLGGSRIQFDICTARMSSPAVVVVSMGLICRTAGGLIQTSDVGLWDLG